MSHEPECLTPDPASPEILCICDRLRACEQRVHLSWQDFAEAAKSAQAIGYAAGVQAARDAVAALPPFNMHSPIHNVDYKAVRMDDALAAIDALKGMSE